MTTPLELLYRPGSAAECIQELWRHRPAPLDGALVGVIHLAGDRGQIQIQVSDVQVRQLVLLACGTDMSVTGLSSSCSAGYWSLGS